MKKIFALLVATVVIASASFAQDTTTHHKTAHKTMHKTTKKTDSTMSKSKKPM